MVEGGKIDWSGHENDLARNIGETIGFDAAVRAAQAWAADRNDTLIIVTADHETGGLRVTADNGKNVLPGVTWATTGHTAAPVPIYAVGPGAEFFQGSLDNTDIFRGIARAVGIEQSPLLQNRPPHAAIRLRHSLLQSGADLTLQSEATDPLSGRLQLPLENSSAQPLSLALRWSIPDHCPWRIEPVRQEVSLAPERKGTMESTIEFVGDLGILSTRSALPSAVVDAWLGEEVVLTEHPIEISQSLSGLLGIGPPTLACRRTESAPRVDALLDDPAWAGQPDIDGFVRTRPNAPPSARTVAWVAADGQGLYFALRCGEPNPGKIRARAAQHDDPVWHDDSIEIFIDANYDRTSFFQIIVSPRGVTFDRRSDDGSWDGTFDSAAAITDQAWLLEVAISWQTLGLSGPPPAGAKIGLNLVRNRPQADAEITQWAPTYQGNWKPQLFGALTF